MCVRTASIVGYNNAPREQQYSICQESRDATYADHMLLGKHRDIVDRHNAVYLRVFILRARKHHQERQQQQTGDAGKALP